MFFLLRFLAMSKAAQCTKYITYILLLEKIKIKNFAMIFRNLYRLYKILKYIVKCYKY